MRQDSGDSRIPTLEGNVREQPKLRIASGGERVNYLHDIEPHLKSGEGLFQDLRISMAFASAVAKLYLVPK